MADPPAPQAPQPAAGTGGSHSRSRIRGRVVAVVALVLVVATTGILLDRAGPRAAGVGPIEGTETGAWFCPHGGGQGWKGWVVLTNPGRADVSVRVTSFGKDGSGDVSSFSVPAGHQVYSEVEASEPGASTAVEYFGGWVGAAAVIQGSKTNAALAGERCAPAPRRTWFLPDQPTGRGETAYAVVMNPFDAPAQFDVVIRTERRTIDPRALTPFVLAPRSSAAIRVNDFALEAPGETTVTTEIIQRIGRVVAGSLGFTSDSLRAEVGVPTTERKWILPGNDQSVSGALVGVNAGGSRADLNVIRQGSSVQEVLSGEDGVSLGPGGVATYAAQDMRGAGLVVQSTNPGRTAMALVLAGPGADSATVDGVASPAARWLVLPTLPPTGGEGVVVLQNPGPAAVQATLMAIGENGSLDLPGLGPVTVPAARTVVIPLQTVTGAPVSVIVSVTGGFLVAAGASSTGGGAGYASTLGLPMTAVR